MCHNFSLFCSVLMHSMLIWLSVIHSRFLSSHLDFFLLQNNKNENMQALSTQTRSNLWIRCNSDAFSVYPFAFAQSLRRFNICFHVLLIWLFISNEFNLSICLQSLTSPFILTQCNAVTLFTLRLIEFILALGLALTNEHTHKLPRTISWMTFKLCWWNYWKAVTKIWFQIYISVL